MQRANVFDQTFHDIKNVINKQTKLWLGTKQRVFGHIHNFNSVTCSDPMNHVLELKHSPLTIICKKMLKINKDIKFQFNLRTVSQK